MFIFNLYYSRFIFHDQTDSKKKGIFVFLKHRPMLGLLLVLMSHAVDKPAVERPPSAWAGSAARLYQVN